jgi:hypothetical protein
MKQEDLARLIAYCADHPEVSINFFGVGPNIRIRMPGKLPVVGPVEKLSELLDELESRPTRPPGDYGA